MVMILTERHREILADLCRRRSITIDGHRIPMFQRFQKAGYAIMIEARPRIDRARVYQRVKVMPTRQCIQLVRRKKK